MLVLLGVDWAMLLEPYLCPYGCYTGTVRHIIRHDGNGPGDTVRRLISIDCTSEQIGGFTCFVHANVAWWGIENDAKNEWQQQPCNSRSTAEGLHQSLQKDSHPKPDNRRVNLGERNWCLRVRAWHFLTGIHASQPKPQTQSKTHCPSSPKIPSGIHEET